MVDYPRLVVGHPFIYFDYRQAIFVTAFALSDTSFTESATHWRYHHLDPAHQSIQLRIQDLSDLAYPPPHSPSLHLVRAPEELPYINRVRHPRCFHYSIRLVLSHWPHWKPGCTPIDIYPESASAFTCSLLFIEFILYYFDFFFILF